MKLLMILILTVTLFADEYHNNDKIDVNGSNNAVYKTVHNNIVIEKQIDTIYVYLKDTIYIRVDGKVVQQKRIDPRAKGYVTDW